MAKSESAPEKQKIEQSDLRKLWRRSTKEWLNLLSTLGVARLSEQGPTVKMCCPYHPDSSPSALVHTEHGYFKCFGCGKFIYDPIRFISNVSGAGYGAALETYKASFEGGKHLDIETLSLADTIQRRVHFLNEAFYSYLCDLWTAEQMPETAKKTIAWLKNRGIRDVQGLGSLGILPRVPTLERLLRIQKATDDDVQWCLRFIGEYLNNAYTDCVVYTYATAPEYITAFKLRPATADKAGIKILEVDKTGEIGAFGVLTPAFYPMYGSDKCTRFLAVEGEHDQLALYCGQIDYGQVSEVVIALGGDGHNGLSFMDTLGFKSCRLIPDDDAAGSVYPTKVLPKSPRINFEVFQWPAALRAPLGGKTDPDEAVRARGFDVAFEAFVAPQNYVFALTWALNAAKAKVQGTSGDNIRVLKEIAEEFAAYLTDESEKFAFAQEFEKLCPNIAASQVIRTALANQDSPLGFSARIGEWFRKTYQVTTWDSHTNELTLWHLQKSRALTVQVDVPASIPKLIKDFSTGSLYFWAKGEIGLPGFLPNPEAFDATEAVLARCENTIEKSIHRALRELIPGASEDISAIKGQGIHLSQAGKTNTGYIVNGRRVFKLLWDDTGEQLIEATQLPGPVDGPVVFDLSRKPVLVPNMDDGWTKLFTNAQDLLQPPPFSAEETFDRVFNIIDTAFGFTHQRIDAMYCAGLVFYNYLYDIFENRRMLTHFSAEYSSGKTSLLSVTSNHAQLQEWSLCDHSHAIDSFTQAGFYQMFANTRLVAALDEMNDLNDNSRDSEKKKEFYAKCRSLATSGQASVSQGTQDGQGRQYSLRTSVITASGNIIHNEMDESRFNTIFLRKDGNRSNVRGVLRKLYSPAEYAQLRLSIFLHSVAMAPRVLKAHRNLHETFSERPAIGDVNNVLDRAAENLLPLGAILDVVGREGAAYVDQYRASRTKQKVERGVTTAGHMLLDLILSTPIVDKDEDNNQTTIKHMLLSGNQREKINQSKTGIYYDATTHCLALAWPEIKTYFRHPALKKNASALIFDLQSAGDWVVSLEKAQASGIYDRLLAVGLVHPPEVVSIVTVKSRILDRVERAVTAQNATPDFTPAEDVMPGL